ncbi:MAG: GNAT family N-acetyltransferase [Rhodothermales bacterium]|nr:GNAT family N-acetyltransferase [Rhodothermales bacterium]
MHLLETYSLSVRQLSRNDVPALTVILSDPEVMKYSIRGICNEEATRDFIDWCLDCYSSLGYGPWALVDKRSGELAGFCGISPEVVNGVEEASLGYRLASKFWNKGLATEAVSAILEYVFDKGLIPSAVTIIEPEHTASLRVSEKAGFKEFRVVEFHDRLVRLYRITRYE